MSGQPQRMVTPLLRLFPPAWRERYEDEFLAMVEEQRPGGRDMLDILLSALDARARPQAWLAQQEPEGHMVLQASSPTPPPGTTIIAGGGPARSGPPPRRFSRRTFLRNALAGSAGVAALVGGGSLLTFSSPNQTGAFGGEVALPPGAIPPVGGAPFKHTAGKFWLINNEDGALALYWKCPHLGCTVPWAQGDDRFECPCHQSRYDRHGVLISGPAPRPMDLMALRVDEHGNVIVDTGTITQRSRYEPGQAVRI